MVANETKPVELCIKLYIGSNPFCLMSPLTAFVLSKHGLVVNWRRSSNKSPGYLMKKIVKMDKKTGKVPGYDHSMKGTDHLMECSHHSMKGIDHLMECGHHSMKGTDHLMECGHHSMKGIDYSMECSYHSLTGKNIIN